MAKINTREGLNFNNAVEMITTKIFAGGKKFFINTEFGKIAFEVHHYRTLSNIYKDRVKAYSWRDAPATEFVALNRNTKTKFYIEMNIRVDFSGKVAQSTDFTMLLVALGLAHCMIWGLRKSSFMQRGSDAMDAWSLVYAWNKQYSHLMDIHIRSLVEEYVLTRYLYTLDKINLRRMEEVIFLQENRFEKFCREIEEYANCDNPQSNNSQVPTFGYYPKMFGGNILYWMLIRLYIDSQCTTRGETDILKNNRLFNLVNMEIDGTIDPYHLVKKIIKRAKELSAAHSTPDEELDKIYAKQKEKEEAKRKKVNHQSNGAKMTTAIVAALEEPKTNK